MISMGQTIIFPLGKLNTEPIGKYQVMFLTFDMILKTLFSLIYGDSVSCACRKLDIQILVTTKMSVKYARTVLSPKSGMP